MIANRQSKTSSAGKYRSIDAAALDYFHHPDTGGRHMQVNTVVGLKNVTGQPTSRLVIHKHMC